MSSNTSRLHVAVKKGDEKKVKQYIQAGDDINAVDGLGSSPLLVAVLHERIKVVQLLLVEAGADTSIENSTHTALSAAAFKGNVLIVKALLRGGADINAGVGSEEVTPLIISAMAGHEGVVRLLIEEGCDVRKRTVSGATALYAAAADRGHINIVDIVLDAGMDVNELSHNGNTVLASVVRSGNLPLTAKLLERGADVSVAESDGYTALHFAACCGSGDITKVLLQAGADPNKGTYETVRTPLHLACMEGHVECARLLLIAGANVSAADCDGSTPLHYVPAGHNDLIELLLSAGSDVNVVNNVGNIPLFDAVQHGDLKAVTLLLEAGSDANRRDKLGRNVLFHTLDLDIVKLLLAKGADATVVDMFGYTLLHNAVTENASGGVICALCRAGADPTARNGDDLTAADGARQRGHTDTAKLLDLLEDKYKETRGNTTENVDSDEAKAAKLSVMTALLDEVNKIIVDSRKAETGLDLDKAFTKDDMNNLLKLLSIDNNACEEVEESVDECKDDKQQSSSALPCLNCEAMTSRRCSGCGISYFCSKKCEMTARHVCCG